MCENPEDHKFRTRKVQKKMCMQLKKKKMMKEEMENNNVVMCHPLQKKQRENTEEIDTASSLHHTH